MSGSWLKSNNIFYLLLLNFFAPSTDCNILYLQSCFFSVAVYYQVVVMSCLRDEFLFQIIGFGLESDFVNKKHAKLWKNPFEINENAPEYKSVAHFYVLTEL